MNRTTIYTDRLILRQFEEADLEAFYAYAKNPNIGPNAGWAPHASIEESAGILEIFMSSNDVWAIAEKENNIVIGSIGLQEDKLRRVPDVRMLGYVLSEDHWNKGYMTEAATALLKFAFSEQQLALVSVNHYPFNKASARVIEKLGFSYDGTLRHAIQIYNGNIYDAVCYSMTRDEFGKKYENE
ncbi:MAG: GNAT family N-acetyltransferase [Christensenellaceae bacterium]|jgi:ribosomal-protein-alanine N-acetyltransferase